MFRQKCAMIMLLLMFSAAAFSQEKMTMDLWPKGALVSSPDKEDKAELTVYLPEAKKATGRAVVCCPGGGYTHLAMDHEGHQWATFFNNQGIALIVLKYRMPHGNPQIPVSDAEQAMKTVRMNATEWHIDRNDVGIMGFSAGGHLASTIATRSKGEAAPNFQILFYPVITMDRSFTHMGSHDFLLGADAPAELERQFSNEKQVNSQTPRALIVVSGDDHVVPPLNSISYYLTLQANGVPAALHVWPTGDHGWGLRSSFAYHAEMLMELKTWLRSF